MREQEKGRMQIQGDRDVRSLICTPEDEARAEIGDVSGCHDTNARYRAPSRCMTVVSLLRLYFGR
jgi:hypothetical protein